MRRLIILIGFDHGDIIVLFVLQIFMENVRTDVNGYMRLGDSIRGRALPLDHISNFNLQGRSTKYYRNRLKFTRKSSLEK